MRLKMGFIAEDMSDINVLKILAKKIISKNISVSHFVGNGCGPLARKTPAWCRSFSDKGCTHVLLVHDLDKNNENDLRRKFETIIKCVPQLVKSVVIPIEEIESWLLSDSNAITRALNLKKPLKNINHPEMIPSPKEHIGEMVRKTSNEEIVYVNTVHNPLIANLIDISKIQTKCPSFAGFTDFLKYFE